MTAIPTYTIEGEISRFDERDTVFSREALVEGSVEEVEYHLVHPEKIEIDRRLARFIRAKMERSSDTDEIARAIYESQFIPSAALALPDMVDGLPAREKARWNPEEAKEKIREFALFLGADDVRIGPLKKEWVYSHRGSRPFFNGGYANPPYFEGIPENYQGARYGERIELDHNCAISMAFRQSKAMIDTGSSRAVDLETGRIYARSVLVSVQLARFIRALGYPARAHHLRNYCILAVPVAVDAGIGELARSGYLVSRRLGANFRLSTVTTAMPLEFDEPVDLGIQDFCDKCKKCAVNCPSGAISRGEKIVVRGIRKWQIDPEACLKYWGHTGYTCSICQSVCPWTKPPTLFHRMIASAAVNLPWIRRALVLGDDIVYGAKFRPAPVPEWLRDPGD
ncbi:MAG: reductive dehalogenase [Candidatus Krumholzibacteriota bacterium]|nr:reductive dehalogenase [Candidatus Krumholzibacteriota bacterium]